MTNGESNASCPGWTARDARPSDRPALVKVFNDAFHRQDQVSLLEWRYDRNPHGRAWTVVAAGSADEPVGSYSYVPRRFVIAGVDATVMQASDAMVFPDWQRKGIFRRLDNLLAERASKAGIPFGFAFCGRRSQKGFLDNGWKTVSRYRTWTRVLRASTAARDARRSDGRLRRALIPLEALRARRTNASIRGWCAGYHDEPVQRFDDRFRAAGAGDFRIIGGRDQSYLTWRYLSTPRRTHRPYLLTRAGEAVGYFDVELTDAGRGYLLDAMGLDEASRRATLAAAVERLRTLGADVIQTTVVEGSHLDTVLRDYGFEPPQEKDILPFIVRVFTPGSASDAALDPRNWCIFDGDRDAEGMT